jgi:hypothetical protein
MVPTDLTQNVLSVSQDHLTQTVLLQERAPLPFQQAKMGRVALFNMGGNVGLLPKAGQPILVNVNFPTLTTGVLASICNAVKFLIILWRIELHGLLLLIFHAVALAQNIHLIYSRDLHHAQDISI